MTLRSVLKHLISKESLDQPETLTKVDEASQMPARSTSQTELVQLFSEELRDHELLDALRQSQTPKT
ncbi:MAG: hypothetical protein AB3N12_12440 [Ruegeria sp.]